MIELVVGLLVAGLGSEDFSVRETCQKTLYVINRELDIRSYLPINHRDPEVRNRIVSICEDYRNIGPLPDLNAFRHYDYQHGPFTFKDQLLAEIALEAEIIRYYDYPTKAFYYVGGSTTAEEHQVVVEYVRRLFDECNMTRTQVRDKLESIVRGDE